MAEPELNSPTVFSEPKERTLVFLLCCLAAIHVFIFSAAFPFFNNVDEPIHFDLVVKYSHGHVPQGLETLSADSAVYLSVYNSMAYLGAPAMFPDGKMPVPPWEQSVEKMRHDFVVNTAAWKAQKNYEGWQPPLYYALGGVWWHLGQWCNFEGGRLLYWLRFLNILVIATLVWLGYAIARMIFPENQFLRLGVPALLAFMPQTAFYSIETDALSPLCFGALFICMIQWMRTDVAVIQLGMMTGLAFAATFLTKLTNLPLLMVCSLIVLFKTWQLFKAGKLRASRLALAMLLLCAGLPIGGWLAWCKHHFGSFTGGELQIEYFGWTHKPFSEWGHHPIFTPHGFWVFVSGLVASFWQGEFWWHDKPMASPTAGVIYVILSICFIGLASIAIIPRFSSIPSTAVSQRQALWFSLGSFVAAVVFFGFLSIIYDFHNFPGSSHKHPYFTFGRHMLGALIPFLLLFVYGLDRTLNRFGIAAKFLALAAMILFMLVSEIAVDWPVFSNEYNWFHM